MRQILCYFLTILLLTFVIACDNEGNADPFGTQQGPVIPGTGQNPGGDTFPMQVKIDLSRNLGNAPLPVNMNAIVVGGSPPYYYRWDVNGDSEWDYGGEGISEIGIHYASPGYYNVHVEVEDAFQQFYHAWNYIEVLPPGPVAVALAYPNEGNGPMDVTLDGGQSYDEDGYIVLYEWDFESDDVWDFESGTISTTMHTYENQGTYNATLRVTDDDGYTSVASVKIVVI